MTTNELISKWYNIADSIEYADSDEQLKELEKVQGLLMNQMLEKVDNIDSFAMSVEETIATYKAKKEVFQKEAKRISSRIASSEKLKKFLNSTLIPSIIKTIGKDGKLSTSSANYTLFNGWGKVIYDPERIDQKYVSVKETTVVDAAQIRKDAISAYKNGESIDGVIIIKEDRIRRS